MLKHPADGAPASSGSNISSILQNYKSVSRAAPAANQKATTKVESDQSNVAGNTRTPSPSIEQISSIPFNEFDPDVLATIGSKISSILKDFLNIKNFEDTMERIEDLAAGYPANIFGAQFVLSFIELTLDCKSAVQEEYMNFLRSPSNIIPKYVIASKNEMGDALASCQSIIMMHESLYDYKNVSIH